MQIFATSFTDFGKQRVLAGHSAAVIVKRAPGRILGTLDRLHLRTEGQQPLEGGLNVVHVPVGHRATGLVWPGVRGEAAVHDAQLVLVVADSELDVRGLAIDFAHEVGLRAEQLGVPGDRGRHVIGE